MGDHASCGKKQYKSAECKARAIMAAAEKGQEPTARQVDFVRRTGNALRNVR